MSPTEEKTKEIQEAPDREDLKKIVECLLFITETPLPLAKLCQCAGIKDAEKVLELVAEIKADLEAKNSSVMLTEVAGGYQMATRPEFAAHVRKLFAERMTMKLSRAAHETLSIIAYKQPLTRAEIEEIRGVDVIAALETLLEKRLVKVVGRKETVGRPLMYGTTVDFLRRFGLKGLEDLPPLESFAAAAVAATAAAAPSPAVGPFSTETSAVEPVAAAAEVTESPETVAQLSEPQEEPPAPQAQN